MERTQAHRQDSESAAAHGRFNAEGNGCTARSREGEASDEPRAGGGRYEERLAKLMRLLNR